MSITDPTVPGTYEGILLEPGDYLAELAFDLPLAPEALERALKTMGWSHVALDPAPTLARGKGKQPRTGGVASSSFRSGPGGGSVVSAGPKPMVTASSPTAPSAQASIVSTIPKATAVVEPPIPISKPISDPNAPGAAQPVVFRSNLQYSLGVPKAASATTAPSLLSPSLGVPKAQTMLEPPAVSQRDANASWTTSPLPAREPAQEPGGWGDARGGPIPGYVEPNLPQDPGPGGAIDPNDRSKWSYEQWLDAYRALPADVDFAGVPLGTAEEEASPMYRAIRQAAKERNQGTTPTAAAPTDGGGGGGGGGGFAATSEDQGPAPDESQQDFTPPLTPYDNLVNPLVPGQPAPVEPLPGEHEFIRQARLTNLWRRWVEWGSPFAVAPGGLIDPSALGKVSIAGDPDTPDTFGAGAEGPQLTRVRFVGKLTEALVLHAPPGMAWLYVEPLPIDPFETLELRAPPPSLETGRSYVFRILARDKAYPHKDDVRRGLSKMGFAPMKISLLQRNIRIPNRPSSLSAWFGIGTWSEPSSVATCEDPFYFESVKEIAS